MSEENKKSVSAEIAGGKKKRGKPSTKHIVLGLLFFLGVLLCSAMAAGLLAHSFITENILAIGGFALAAILLIPFEKWLIRRETNAYPKHNVLLPILLIVAVFAATFAMMFYQLDRSSTAVASGKNVNACEYNHDFTDFGSEDLEELIQEKCGKSEGAPITRIDLKDYHEVFMFKGNEILSYEFAVQKGKYFYIGARKLVYHADNYPTDSYSWQETVFADAAESCLSHGLRFFENGDSDPAWGVTDFDPKETVQIKGKYPDRVKELETNSGSTIYLWIYDDLGNTAELKLKDVTVTDR